MKRIIVTTLVLISALGLSGCATMIRGMKGTTVPVPIKTVPEGATIVCKGQQSTSPTTLELDIRKNYNIVISKAGYKVVKIDLKSKPTGKGLGASFLENTLLWGWWNLGIGTVVGMVVDATSGAMDEYDSKGICVYLEPGEGEIIMTDDDLIKATRQRTKSGKLQQPELESDK